MILIQAMTIKINTNTMSTMNVHFISFNIWYASAADERSFTAKNKNTTNHSTSSTQEAWCTEVAEAGQGALDVSFVEMVTTKGSRETSKNMNPLITRQSSA